MENQNGATEQESPAEVDASGLNALVMRSLVNMLPKYDDLFWAESPDDLKCDIDFAKEHLMSYVAEFARLQEIDKTTDSVTAEWSRLLQQMEKERDHYRDLAMKYESDD